MRTPPPLSAGAGLLPLRLFLGVTFVYAGVHKLADGGFLRAGSDTYIGSQLEAFAEGTPGGWLLETFALPQPVLAGIGVALAEVAIGLLAIAGRFTRATALAGLGLSLVLFLTASWHTRPYFLGSDIVFAFAWLPFALAGASGQPALDHRVRRRALRLGRRGRLVVPVSGELLTRRAAVLQALGLTAAATSVIAGVSFLARGAAPARATAAPGRGDRRLGRGRRGRRAVGLRRRLPALLIRVAGRRARGLRRDVPARGLRGGVDGRRDPLPVSPRALRPGDGRADPGSCAGAAARAFGGGARRPGVPRLSS